MDITATSNEITALSIEDRIRLVQAIWDGIAAEQAYPDLTEHRFANRSGKPKLTVVVLDEDVAEVFSTPESVNKLLRALIETMPQASSSETA